jgi:spermidine synthase
MINLRSIIYPLFLLSGFAGLVYETVWIRQFTGIFGSTAGSVGVVTAAFMSGMAIGGILLGRLGDHLPKRLLLFAALEGLIGVYGIFSSFFFDALEAFYYSGGYPHGALRFLLAGAFLIVPTFLMGGTLPVLSRHVLRSGKENFGSSAGTLYAVGTLGAALGTLAAGFYLLENLGALATLRTAGGVSLFVAASAFLLHAADRDRTAGAGGEVASPPLRPPAEPSPAPSLLYLIPVVLAVILSGASVLSQEVIWTRFLSQFFRNSIYSFSGMLICVLAGLAAGGGFGAWLSGRLRVPRVTLALFQLAASASTLGTLFILRHFSDLDRYRELIASLGGFESFGVLVLIEIGFAFCVIFPPAFFLGTAFPFMAAMSWRRAPVFGGFVGDIQFLSTAGAVAGSLLAAFWLLPSGIGLQYCLFVAAGFNVVAAFLFLLAGPREAGWKGWSAAVLLAAATVALGLFQSEPLKFWKGAACDKKLLFYCEDAVANVAVVERPDGLILKVNNTSGLGGTAGEMLESRLGLFPGLLHEQPESGLCLGLGTGSTLIGLIGSGMRTVDCVEIVPGVMKASHFFHDFEQEVPADCKVGMYQLDARIFLAAESKTYDVIVGDLYFPWQSGAGFLYSLEHFELVREHLNPGGIFCQWIPLYQMHWEDFGDIGFTFSEVFDNVAVFLASAESSVPVLGLVGTLDRLRIDPDAMQKRLDGHVQKMFIEYHGMQSARENLSLYIGNEWLFREQFPDARVNTVDRTLVEYRTARVHENQAVLAWNHFCQLAAPGFKESVLSLLDLSVFDGQERRDMEVELRDWSEGMRGFLASHAFEVGLDILTVPNPTPEREGEIRRMIEARFETGLAAFVKAPGHSVLRGNVIRIWQSLIRSDNMTVAANLMGSAFAASPDDAELAYNWGLSYLLQVQDMYGEACVAFVKALEVNPDLAKARMHWAFALFCDGKRVKAREELKRAVGEMGGKVKLSKLTSGLTTLILEGAAAAHPLLDGFAGKRPWDRLIERAFFQAAAREKTNDGGEPESK